MRGLGSAGLRIPFEREAPVEGANLSPGDFAPRAARRPSPGFHPLPCTPEGAAGVNFFAGGASTWAVELTWTSYKSGSQTRLRAAAARTIRAAQIPDPTSSSRAADEWTPAWGHRRAGGAAES